jgi:glycosyltransferase involved in cell wall biosynthesis
MTKPSILFLCSALQTGGAERQWSVLLPGLAKRGFNVRLMTLNNRGRFFDEIEKAGVPSECVELRGRWDWRGIRRALSAAEPTLDIVVTQETNAQVLGHFIASRAGALHVTIEHTAPGRRRSLHRRLLARFVSRRVDLAIAVSNSQLSDLATLGFDRQRVRVVYNGVPLLRPLRPRAEVRASLGIQDGDFVAIVVATLRPVKRVHVFVEAVALANRGTSRIKGLVAGGGPQLNTLRRAAAERGSQVTILGERDDIADLITASDVVCLTSSTESTPIALIEAMALGRPVLAPAVGGVAEVVEDGETGILLPSLDAVSLAEALQRLASDASRVQVLGQAGRARYEDLFTADRMLQAYGALFEEMVRAIQPRAA